MQKEELHELLEHLHDKYNRTEFIEPDPISIPHSFSDRHDREIAGFMAAAIAWGNRKAIVNLKPCHGELFGQLLTAIVGIYPLT